MKPKKSVVKSKESTVPDLKFVEQELTSFGGLIIFQALFIKLGLKDKLKQCFPTIASKIFQPHIIAMILIVNILVGFRRLSDISYYHDDPMVLRLLSLNKLPDASTLSRTLSDVDINSISNVEELVAQHVIDDIRRGGFSTITVDFDGSVQTTKGHSEGTAVGFNKVKKGARSYYILFCTIAQTGQILAMLHRPGNVHDSNGAVEFIIECLSRLRKEFPTVTLESRLDSAFFNEQIFSALKKLRVQFSISVPFERLPELKKTIEQRKRWRRIDDTWSFFERTWKPKSWSKKERFIFVRQKVRKQKKGPIHIQTKIFEPVDFNHDYRVIISNKRQRAKTTIKFHHGRGSQEKLFGDAKNDAALGVIATHKLYSNQLYTLLGALAHNLSRSLQIISHPARKRALLKRPAGWTFLSLGTIRHRLIQRAGRLIRPQGKVTLCLSQNQSIEEEITHLMEAIQKAA